MPLVSAAGTVTQLHRWPVKSMGGEPVDALAVDGRGGAGRPRPRRLRRPQGSATPADRAPGAAPAGLEGRLRRGPDRDPPCAPPTATEWAWSDPGLPAALSADLGREVTLRSDPALQQDLPDSLLVTVQSTLDAVSSELGAELDLRRFRTNIHVELDAEAFAEKGWEGRTLRVGAAELRLLHPCERCAIPTRDPDTQEKWAPLLRHLFDRHSGRFGINARARGEATIAIGDRVTLD